VYVYVSAPVKRIVARFEYSTVYGDYSQEDLWRLTCDRAGISQEQFYAYFGDVEKCSAVNITNVEVLDVPFDPKSVDSLFCAPMNFCYLPESLMVLESIFAENKEVS
jgi:predicted transcriptional regulator